MSWGLFGGGAGGGSSSKTHDSTWSENAESTTYTSGGDPAIKSFNSTDDWKQWVESIETTLPVMTSYTLEPIHLLAGTKQQNVKQAVTEYALANNVTFPAADLTQLRMDWCDCYRQVPTRIDNSAPDCSPDDPTDDECVVHHDTHEAQHSYMNYMCNAGFVLTQMQGGDYKNSWNTGSYNDAGGYQCCRPCFTASN